MNHVKLCMLDEPLEQEKLRSLVSACPEIVTAETRDKALLESRECFLPTFSHGTLCMAVLVESLQKLEVLQSVELYHFSLGFLANSRSEHALLEGLEYCVDQNINLVSCSVGLFQRIWATPIISFLHGREKPLVIAAAANNQHITYPAALPSALGVKLSEESLDAPCAIVKPSDGIDLLARCSESEVLNKTGYGFSNSILVPQLCAQTAKLVLQGIPAEKEMILSALSNGTQIIASEKPMLLGSQNPDDEPPVVLLPYSGKGYMWCFRLAVRLQREFEENEYCCAVLSDRLQGADFEEGHFPVDPQNLERDISYFTRAAEHSLFLLVAEEKVSCDLQLDEREISADQVSELFKKILTTFPDS